METQTCDVGWLNWFYLVGWCFTLGLLVTTLHGWRKTTKLLNQQSAITKEAAHGWGVAIDQLHVCLLVLRWWRP
ncbi:MAG TPA: hypothetical protein VK630_15885 [Reyranella sp.]|nr:hypothetical protein [Reyranella sp.]